MKISPISEYMSLVAEHPIRVRLALNISVQARVGNEPHETLSSTHAIPVSTQTSIYA
jgi:hypothetical protein